jgi:hypothetical protein
LYFFGSNDSTTPQLFYTSTFTPKYFVKYLHLRLAAAGKRRLNSGAALLSPAKLRDLAIQFTKMILILLFTFPVFTRNLPTRVVMKYKGGK